MKKLICSLLVVVMALTGISFSGKAETASAYEAADTYEAVVVNSVKPAEKADISAYLPKERAPAVEQPTVEVAVATEPEVPSVSQEEIELIALCVMAEAEGECEYGQRLVIDVILNRVDDPHFPDTIYDVIYQKNQFSGMYGDRITRCYVKDELVQLVREELESRTNYDAVFFRTGHYHSYGVPMFQVGAHYFSSYD